MSRCKAPPKAPPDYISGLEVCKRLHCNPRHLAKLVRLGRLGVRRLPGVAQDRYRRADVEAIASVAIVPARADQPGAAPSRVAATSKPGRPAHSPKG